MNERFSCEILPVMAAHLPMMAESVVTDFGDGFVMDDFIMAKDLA